MLKIISKDFSKKNLNIRILNHFFLFEETNIHRFYKLKTFILMYSLISLKRPQKIFFTHIYKMVEKIFFLSECDKFFMTSKEC